MCPIPQTRTNRNPFSVLSFGNNPRDFPEQQTGQVNNNYQSVWEPANIHPIVYLVNGEISANTDGGIVIKGRENNLGQPYLGRSLRSPAKSRGTTPERPRIQRYP